MPQFSFFFLKTRDRLPFVFFHESHQASQPRNLRTLVRCMLVVSLLAGLSTHTWAQCFQPTTNYPVGTSPRSLAMGDFNGDGKVDLAVGNRNANTVSILLGNGLGSFSPQTTFATGANPLSVAVGDFNNDGKVDLAVANSTGNTVSVLLGDGTGNFGTQTTFAVGNGPYSVTSGDFNGDNKVDLAVANFTSNTVSVLLGDGTGSFGPQTTFAVGSSPYSVVISDFNGDTKIDLVVANSAGSSVSVLLGDGTGRFGPKMDYVTGFSPFSVAVGDVNGDAKADLITANRGGNTVSILLGDGLGSFGPKTDFATGDSPYSVAVGDVNSDGKADLAVANRFGYSVSILLGDGQGNFAPKFDITPIIAPFSVVLGDVNSDGNADILTTNNGSNDISVLLNCSPVPSLSLVTSATPNPVCAGTSTALSVNASGSTAPYSYTWAAPAGITLSATSTSTVSASVDASLSGPQTITVTVAASGGSPTSTSLVSLTVNATPTVSINPSIGTPTGATLTCASPAASLTAVGNGTYQWNTGQTTQVISATSMGIYSVTVTSPTGCTASASIQVNEDKTPPTVSISPASATLTCANPTVNLSAVGTGTFQWNTSATTQTISVTAGGPYSVTLTGANGCSNTASILVSQDKNSPAVSINPASATICQGQTALLTASGADIYQWRGPQGFASAANPVTVSNPGTYTVTGTTSAGCSATATATLTVNPTPSVSLAASGTLTCTQTSVTLTAQPTGLANYAFTGPGLNQSGGANMVTASQPGSYSVVATTTSGCSASASTTVEQNRQLAAPSLHTASGQTNLTVPQYSGTVTLLIEGCSGTASWRGPAGSTGTGTTITVPTTQTGRFVYQATCQLGTCQSEPASATITVQAETLKILVGSYDCASRQLSLRTTGGNGQPIEYQIPSVTTGWDNSSVFSLQDKHIGKSLKLRARQRSSTNGGWDEAEISFTPQACGARLAADGVEVPLQVVVLGNPVLGQQVEVEVRGVQGQPLQLRVLNLKGEVLDEQHQPEAQSVERIRLRVGEGSGIYLLQALTPTQQRSVKLLKP